MGNALRVKGELDAAIEQFTQALSIKPDFAEAHYNLGVALQEKDDFNAAIGSYEKACVINPSYIKAYLKRLAFNLIHILPRRRSSNIRQE